MFIISNRQTECLPSSALAVVSQYIAKLSLLQIATCVLIREAILIEIKLGT